MRVAKSKKLDRIERVERVLKCFAATDKAMSGKPFTFRSVVLAMMLARELRRVGVKPEHLYRSCT